MTTERQRRIAQQRLFHEGDYPALIASLAGRLIALEAHAVKNGYEPPQEADPLSAVLERAERARENIEARERPEPELKQPETPAGPPPDFVDLVREGEAWGEAEKRLIGEYDALTNQLMGGWIDEAGRAKHGRLARLFSRRGSIAVDSL